MEQSQDEDRARRDWIGRFLDGEIQNGIRGVRCTCAHCETRRLRQSTLKHYEDLIRSFGL